MLYRIINSRTGSELASRAKIADSFFSRMCGLLGKKALAEGEALVIRPCRQVHMMLMSFAIDVVLCDGGNQVVAYQERLKAWRLSRHEPAAASVIELPAGSCAGKLEIGDVLEINAIGN